MTTGVTNQNNTWSGTGDGVSPAHFFDNIVYAAADIDYYEAGVKKVLTTDYAVTGVGADGGGSVVPTVITPNGVVWKIVSNIPNTQSNTGPFDTTAIMTGLNRLTRLVQQVFGWTKRGLRLDESDAADSVAPIPALASLAGQVLGFDNSAPPKPVGYPVAVPPAPTGAALSMLRINATQTAYEFRTAAEVIADLFGDSTGTGPVVRSASATFSGTLAGTYTIPNTVSIQVAAINLAIEDGTDTTKVLQLDVSGITHGRTRTLSAPDHDGMIATQDGAETLTHKVFDTAAATGNALKINGNAVSTVASLQGIVGQSQVYTAIAPAVNFNAVGDTQFTIPLPTGFTRWTLNSCRIDGASVSLTTAQFGLFSGAGGTGTAIIASGTPCTVSTASENTANNAQSQGQSIANASFNFATVWFRITNPQGVAATANVAIILTPLP